MRHGGTFKLVNNKAASKLTEQLKQQYMTIILANLRLMTKFVVNVRLHNFPMNSARPLQCLQAGIISVLIAGPCTVVCQCYRSADTKILLLPICKTKYG